MVHQSQFIIIIIFLISGFLGCYQPEKPVFVDPFALLTKADSLRKIGQAKSNINRLDDQDKEAIDLYRQALPILRLNYDSLACWLAVHRKIAMLLDMEFKDRVGSFEQVQTALSEYQQWRTAETATEQNQLFRFYLREMKATLDIGDLMRLKEVFDRAEPLFHSTCIYGKNHDFATYFYEGIVNINVRMGEYGNANNYFQESLIYEKKFDLSTVASFNDYGSAFLSQDNYPVALSIFKQGLNRGLVDSFYYTMLVLNESETLARLGRVTEAIAANIKAAQLLKDTTHFGSDDYVRIKIGSLENEAIIAEKQNNWSKANYYYQKTIDYAISKQFQRRETASFLAAAANTYFQRKDYAGALAQYHTAYLKFYPNAPKSVDSLPKSGDLLTDKILIEVLEGKARCWSEMGQFDRALAVYELIPAIETQLRTTHTFESSTLRALQKSRQRFNDAVKVAWNAFEKTRNPAYADKAFQFTEQARGVLQTKGIKANEAYTNLSPEEQRADRDLSLKIASLETQLAASNDEPFINTLMKEIREQRNEQKVFREKNIRTNPAYASAMGASKVLNIKDIASLLRPGQVLLDYYFADSTQLFVFAFDQKGNASWTRRNWTVGDHIFVDSLLHQISDDQNNGSDEQQKFKTAALGLGQQLLPGSVLPKMTVCLGQQIPQEGASFIVVPDLSLAALPFEVLLTESPADNAAWSDLPYALRKYSISYAYSASLLGIQRGLTDKRKGNARISFAGFAPNYRDAGNRLDSAAADVAFGAKLFNGQSFTQGTATEANFRAVAEDAQILLLSMHGVSDHAQPGLSRLQFDDTDTKQDNTLYANELQSISCRADLAIMSACFSGDGPIQVGEGAYSLARSFAISGVPSTVMSLWKLPVISSSNLVRDFLSAIKSKDTTKDNGLQMAKITWLDEHQQSKFAHPYYWAGLVTAGDSSALEIDGYSWKYTAGIGLFCLIVVGVFLRNWRKIRDTKLA